MICVAIVVAFFSSLGGALAATGALAGAVLVLALITLAPVLVSNFLTACVTCITFALAVIGLAAIVET